MKYSREVYTEVLLKGPQIKSYWKKQNKKTLVWRSQGTLINSQHVLNPKRTGALPSIPKILNCPISLICALQEQKCAIL